MKQHSQGNEIGDEGAKNLADASAINNTLTTLNMRVIFEQPIFKTESLIEIQHSQGNEIGDEGAKNMAEALAINNTLTTLNMRVIFEQPILRTESLIEIQHHRTISWEMKEQRTWQKHWQSTTH